MARQRVSEATAYHEAGHVVATWLVGYASAIERVSILPAEDFLGVLQGGSPLSWMDLEWGSSTEVAEALENDVVILHAGPLAQKRYSPRSWRQGHGSKDFKDAAFLVGKLANSFEQQETLEKELCKRAELLIHENWTEVAAVAKALLEQKELTGEEVTQLLETLTGEVIPRSSLFDYVDLNSFNLSDGLTEA